MCKGKLYSVHDEQFVTNISYQFQSESPRNWWGELIPVEYVRIDDSRTYTIELEDKRKCRCYLRKRVNRATVGIPPRYVYKFSGIDTLEQTASKND